MFDESLAVFKSGGISHIIMIFVATLAVILCIGFKDKVVKSRFLEITLGICMLLLELVYMIWQFKTQGFRIEQLPLHLCTLSLYINVFMLLTGIYKPVKYTGYWSIGGPILAVIIPMQGYEFPHYRFIHYYLNHILILLSTLYLMYINRVKVYFKTALIGEFGLLFFALMVVFPVNLNFKTNFMYYTYGDNYLSTVFNLHNAAIAVAAGLYHQAMYWLQYLLTHRSVKCQKSKK